MVVGIVMKHLKDRDLLAGRQVSKCWNKAASSVLRKRSTMIKNISGERKLMKLEECMQQSWDFPFAGLKFDEPWTLRTARAIKFFQDYGHRFIRLCLDTQWTIRLQDLAPFINHLPHLSILDLGWSPTHPPFGARANNQNLDLSSVKTIRIWLRYPHEMDTGVLRQVFKAAASPELRIECPVATYEILSSLKSAGKLQRVSYMNVSKNKEQEGRALRVDNLLSTQAPVLTKLVFMAGGCISGNGLIKLLISSKETLKYLRLVGLYPSEFSEECPVLSKLTTLNLLIDRPCKYVFPMGRGGKFPELKELRLGMLCDPSTVNMSDGSFVVESLKKIDLDGHVDKAVIEDLARSFPNVTEVRLEELDSERWWYCDPTDIWSVGAFKKLEKLWIWNYPVQPPNKIFRNYKKCKGSTNFKEFRMMNMDSLLTGAPISICEDLRKQPQQNLEDSPFSEILRDRPSIIQLKNLKELIVCVKLEETEKPLPEEPLFVSMVSVWYALQMMPKLTAKFVYDYDWPSEDFDENDRDKAVKKLKAAFKNVQSYVELEPFFVKH